MNIQLIEPIQTIDEIALKKFSASEVLDLVIRTLEKHAGYFFTNSMVKIFRCFIEEAGNYSVISYRRQDTGKILLGELQGDEVGQGLRQWFYQMLRSEDVHPLTSTYALETCVRVFHLLYGHSFFDQGNSLIEFVPIVQRGENSRDRLFDEKQLKKSMTEVIKHTILKFVIPENAEVQTTEGKIVAGPGAVIRGEIIRCHRSEGIYDHSWYMAKRETMTHFDVTTADGFEFHSNVGRTNSMGICPKMNLPIEWAAGVLHGDGIQGPDYEFEPAPDWRDRSQVFGYQRKIEILRPREVYDPLRTLQDFNEI